MNIAHLLYLCLLKLTQIRLWFQICRAFPPKAQFIYAYFALLILSNSKIMRKSILIPFLIILIVACSNDNEHPVPNTPYLGSPICINDVEYFNLLNNYGIVFLENEGYLGNGILVVNVGNNEFMAYDATCPYEVQEGCKVLPDKSSMILVECKCCGSKYEVTFGDVNTGPSNYPLKKYKTAYDGACIRIY